MLAVMGSKSGAKWVVYGSTRSRVNLAIDLRQAGNGHKADMGEAELV